MYGSYHYLLVLYYLSVLHLPHNALVSLERVLYQFYWGKRGPLMRQEICRLHQSEGCLPVLSVQSHRHTLRNSFLGWTIIQYDETGDFWKEDGRKAFSSLRSVHLNDVETHCLSRNEYPFYHKCRHASRVFSRLQTGLSDCRPLSSKTLYRTLLRAAVRYELINEVSVTKKESRLLWTWAPGMKWLNNDEASLTWLEIRNALWVDKSQFTARLAISPECTQYGDIEGSISQAFFHCLVVRPLCKLLEGYLVRVLNEKFCPRSQFCVQQCGSVVE